MSEQKDTQEQGPDFTLGVALTALADGEMKQGHIGDTPALAVRRGNEIHFIGATCSHYGLPLEKGLVDGSEVHCPFHHARFCIKTGAAVGAPALDSIPSWQVVRDGECFIAGPRQQPLVPITLDPQLAGARDRIDSTDRSAASERTSTVDLKNTAYAGTDASRKSSTGGAHAQTDSALLQQRVVIVGGGGAGHAAATMLRAEGHRGSITVLSAEADLPYDRPACSKTILNGAAKPDDAILHSRDDFARQRITVETHVDVRAIDASTREVRAADGRRWAYDALLLATGAEPKRLTVPGATLPHVHTLRTLDDARRLAAASETAKRAVVVGASFIGLEAAASLRKRGLSVDIVSPAPLPMEKLLGKAVSAQLRKLHESHGVRFHVGTTAAAITPDAVTLDDGSTIPADLVLVGIGVAPRTALAATAGVRIDDGILVDAHLRTNVPGIYAAGDVARWPDPWSGEAHRIEHWVLAERQGQAVARTILGDAHPFRQVPFFWSMQYDVSLGYVGHVDEWDHVVEQGSLADKDWSMTYFKDGEPRAMALVKRNLDGLKIESEMERRLAEIPVGM
jgi:3-phenylpropionate/trans-cinnamate dioxygenase ferredoxin reductase subunit